MSEEKKVNKDENAASLGKQLGGYKTQLANCQKKLAKTREELLAVQTNLKSTILSLEEAKGALEVIKKEQKAMLKIKEEMSLKIDILSNELTFYKTNYEHFKSLKWYERIFAK